VSASSPDNAPKRPNSRLLILFSGLGLGAFWILSIVLHTAFFGIAIVATPPAPSTPASSEFAMTISPDRVREVVEDIRDRESEAFKDKVEELVQIKKELDLLNAEKIEQYNEVMREAAKEAPERLLAAADEAVAAQTAALDAQLKAQTALDEVKTAYSAASATNDPTQKLTAEAAAEAASKTAKAAQDAAELAQKQVAIAQGEIVEQLQRMANPEEASAAMQTAVTAQTEATQGQVTAESQLNGIPGHNRALATARDAAERERAAIAPVNEQIAPAQANVAARREALSAAEKKLAELRATAQTTVTAAATASTAADQAAAEAKKLADLAKQTSAVPKKQEGVLANAERTLVAAQQAIKTSQEAQARQQKKTAEAPEPARPKEQATLETVTVQVVTAEAAAAIKAEEVAAAKKLLEEARAAAAKDTEAAKLAAEAAKLAAEEKKRLSNLVLHNGRLAKNQEGEFAQAQRELRKAEDSTKRAQEALAKQQKKADDATAALNTRQAALDTAVLTTGSQQQAAIAAQKNSLDLQKGTAAALAKAVANANTEKAADALAEKPDVIDAPNPDEAQNLADLFAQAQAAELAVAETFKNVRAAELAAIRKITLAEALALTEVAKPERGQINTAILKSDVADVKAVREHESAVTAANNQMESMVALAQRMRQLAKDTGPKLTLAAIQTQSARYERLENLAMEDSGTKAKDLSQEMANADRQSAMETGPSATDVAMVRASVELAQNPLSPAALIQLNQAMQLAAQARAQAAAQAALAAAGGANSGKTGQQGQGAPAIPGIAASQAKDYRPLHGRTVRAGMVSIERGRNPAWMYVDAWHIIGPWPNPGRKNLNTKFPPETVVDLDAVYQGGRKDEAPLPIRWKFFQLPHQAKGPDNTPSVSEIMPPGMSDYEIYYAYTELWFDVEADLWVGIGSDDQSKIWINDQLIWRSADAHKPWSPNEGLRKVHFRKGINRVLYRLENGQGLGGFSLIVCLSEPK
jgi:hypothetical protein